MPQETHGLTKRVYDKNGKRIVHPLFNTWRGMKERCQRSNHISYENYGNRGIGLCQSWQDFGVFAEWALTHGWEKGLQIDRIDNNESYSPANCRFVTHSENVRNQRTIRKDNTSGYRGVCLDKRSKKKPWFVRLNYNKIQTRLAPFSTALEAAVAREIYIIENKLNLPLNGVMDSK